MEWKGRNYNFSPEIISIGPPGPTVLIRLEVEQTTVRSDADPSDRILGQPCICCNGPQETPGRSSSSALPGSARCI